MIPGGKEGISGLNQCLYLISRDQLGTNKDEDNSQGMAEIMDNLFLGSTGFLFSYLFSVPVLQH